MEKTRHMPIAALAHMLILLCISVSGYILVSDKLQTLYQKLPLLYGNINKYTAKYFPQSKDEMGLLNAYNGSNQSLSLAEDKMAIEREGNDDLSNKVPQTTRENTTTAYSMDFPLTHQRQVLSNGLILHGGIGRNTTYAVFSASRPKGNAYNYVFDLPLSVTAWSRIGFRSMILIVDDESHWRTDKLLSIILKELLSRNDSVLIFMPAETKYAILLSQTGRLFLPMLIPGLSDDVYLLTSDADLWPLSRSFYHSLIDRKRVSSTNYMCCGEFNHKGVSYRMLPMCHIGMTVRLWKSIMRFPDNRTSWRAEQIIDYLKNEFGDKMVDTPQDKGGNPYWYMDQHLISVRIGQWGASRNTSSLLNYVSRHTSNDRIDRSYWEFHSIGGKVDTHILIDAYRKNVWPRIQKILELMFEDAIVSKLDKYQAEFLSQQQINLRKF